MNYPKINSLYNRRPAKPRDLIIGEYCCPEFEEIQYWETTEKIDGTNCVIILEIENFRNNIPFVFFRGRDHGSALPAMLVNWLKTVFNDDVDKYLEIFPTANRVYLYGEGIGPGINIKDSYSEYEHFVLFDVVVDGFFLSRENVIDVAQKMQINYVPVFPEIRTREQIIEFVQSCPQSTYAEQFNRDIPMEGVVCRAKSGLLFKKDQKPVMFKLKCKDFK